MRNLQVYYLNWEKEQKGDAQLPLMDGLLRGIEFPFNEMNYRLVGTHDIQDDMNDDEELLTETYDRYNLEEQGNERRMCIGDLVQIDGVRYVVRPLGFASSKF